MPLLAIVRKDTGWRIDWQSRRLPSPWTANPATPTRKRFYCGGIVASPGFAGRTLFLHAIVVDPAASHMP